MNPLNELTQIQTEKERRAKEALRCYRPAKQMPFHMSSSSELLISGGKRSGKTTGAAAEFASRVTGIPIHGPSGKMITPRWPVAKPDDKLLFWVIGWDIDHIGQTIYYKLFEPGLFRVIKDLATGIWRTFNPADPYDAQRESDSEPAGPLIPERLIDMNSWSWEDKKANNFSSVRLKNGATICAYPSSAKHPKQGDAVSGIWIDEDIQFASHLKEWQDRLTDKDGWFLWSVWPHAKNYALVDLIDRAEECEDDPDPQISHFQLAMSENPFIPDSNKSKALGRMGSEEEVARRDRGDLLRGQYSMYDFHAGYHCVENLSREEMHKDPEDVQDLVAKVLSQHGRLPREWTRYLAIDPSHTRTAVTFGVVPPPEWFDFEIGDLLIVEDELIVRKASAKDLARRVREMVTGLNYEAFVCDQQIGKQTRVGTDKTVFQIYANAFAKERIISRTTKSTFAPGCNVPTTRYAYVRSLLEAGPKGTPRLMFIGQKTPVTQSEFKTYQKKKVDNHGIETILDEPENPRKHDAMAGLEYLCAYVAPLFEAGTAYVEPHEYAGQGSPAYRRAQQMLAKTRSQSTNEEYVHLGPGGRAA